MRRHPSHMTVLRHQPRQPAQVDGYAADLWAEVVAHQSRGFLAGALCLAMAQVNAVGRPGEASAVLDLAVELAVKCEQAMAEEHAIRPVAALPPPGVAEILAAYDVYRATCHFWAAAVYGRIQLRQDLIPRSLQAIPRFVAYAAEIARLASALQWPQSDQGLALPPSLLWTLLLPDALTRRAEVEIRQPAAMATPPARPAAGDAADTDA